MVDATLAATLSWSWSQAMLSSSSSRHLKEMSARESFLKKVQFTESTQMPRSSLQIISSSFSSRCWSTLLWPPWPWCWSIFNNMVDNFLSHSSPYAKDFSFRREEQRNPTPNISVTAYVKEIKFWPKWERKMNIQPLNIKVYCKR